MEKSKFIEIKFQFPTCDAFDLSSGLRETEPLHQHLLSIVCCNYSIM